MMTLRRNATSRLVGAVAVAVLSLVLARRSPATDDRMEARQLVERAELTLQGFLCDSNMEGMRTLLTKAQGVLIVPELLKGAFVFGASGGSGVLVVRDEEHKTWSEPAFMTLGGVSFGPQIGGQSSEVVLVALSDRGVRSLLANSFKLSGEAGLAVGPIGMGAAAATANLSADIVSFSRSKGLYGGLSLDGAVVAVRSDLNDAYYGRTASPTDILITRDAKSAHDTSLSDAVGRSASGSAMGNCPSAERPRG